MLPETALLGEVSILRKEVHASNDPDGSYVMALSR